MNTKISLTLSLLILSTSSISAGAAPARPNGSGSSGTQPDSSTRQAKSKLSPGENTEAPSTCEALVLLNYKMRETGDYQAAEKALNQALKLAKLDMDKIRVFNAFGGLYLQSGNFKESERYLRSTVSLAEKTLAKDSIDQAAFLDNLALACGNNGNFQDALAFNGRAMEIYKNHQESPHATIDLIKALDNRSGILSCQKKFKEAREVCSEAVEMAKNFKNTPPELLACMEDNLGGYYAQEGDYSKAEELKVSALALLESSLGFKHPDTIKAQKNLAFVYTRQGKFDEALTLLKSSIDKLKGTGSVNNDLLSSCMQDYEIVLDLKKNTKTQKQPPPSPLENELMQGFQLLKKGETEEAKAMFDKLIKSYPKDYGAYAGRAIVYHRKGEPDNELSDLDKTIELHPTEQFYFARAQLYLEKREHAKVIEDLKHCIQLDKAANFKEANFLLGASLVEIDKPQEGLLYLNSYIEKVKDNPQAYVMRSAANLKLGKKDAAEEDMKMAKELGFKFE